MHKQNRVVIAKQGPLILSELQGKASGSCLPPELFLLSETLTRVSRILFQPKAWDFPCPIRVVQLYPHLHFNWQIRLASFDQSGQGFFFFFGPIKLGGFGVLVCIRIGHQGLATGTLVYISQLRLYWGGGHFRYHWRLCFPSPSCNTRAVQQCHASMELWHWNLLHWGSLTQAVS